MSEKFEMAVGFNIDQINYVQNIVEITSLMLRDVYCVQWKLTTYVFVC